MSAMNGTNSRLSCFKKMHQPMSINVEKSYTIPDSTILKYLHDNKDNNPADSCFSKAQ